MIAANGVQYECASFIIDTWTDSVAHGRTNVAPAKMPWDLIRTLITETYGGKIDDKGDFQQLDELVHQIITPAAYEEGHRLVEETNGQEGDSEPGAKGGLTVPEGTTMPDFVEWVNALPEREPPTYLGLPANAEKVLLVGHSEDTVFKLGKIAEMLSEGEQLMAEAEKEG